MNSTDEKIFRSYSLDEVLEILDFIDKNHITDFKIENENEKEPWSYISTTIVEPNPKYNSENEESLFSIYYMTGDDEKLFRSDVSIDYVKNMVMTFKNRLFEVWCPSWEVCSIKPVHKKDM